MDILKNKQYKSYSRLSRYSNFPYYYNSLDNKYQYGTVSNLSKDGNYTKHTVKQGETFDSIAIKYYNNPTYYWIICNFNNISDCFEKPIAGSVLLIPSLSTLSFVK